jgi:hypothetical protein
MSEAFDSSTATGSGPVAPRTIERTPGRTPLIGDYEERRRTFTWDDARGGSTGCRMGVSTLLTRRWTDTRPQAWPTRSR